MASGFDVELSMQHEAERRAELRGGPLWDRIEDDNEWRRWGWRDEVITPYWASTRLARIAAAHRGPRAAWVVCGHEGCRKQLASVIVETGWLYDQRYRHVIAVVRSERQQAPEKCGDTKAGHMSYMRLRFRCPLRKCGNVAVVSRDHLTAKFIEAIEANAAVRYGNLVIKPAPAPVQYRYCG